MPVHKVAAKDAAGLKKAAGMKKKAALKRWPRPTSALLRQKKLAGQQLAGRKSTMTKEMGGIKKVAQPEQGRDRSQRQRIVHEEGSSSVQRPRCQRRSWEQ